MVTATCSCADGLGVADAVVKTPVDALKHFSAQPATDPQSLGPLLQGLPCGQQSGGAAVTDAAAKLAVSIPPGSGSMATDIATRATKMTRNVLMASA
jgi:hypothetical protein